MKILNIISILLLSVFLFSAPVYSADEDTSADSNNTQTDEQSENEEESGDLGNDDEEITDPLLKDLKELFAGVTDNYSCSNPGDSVVFPYGTKLEACIRKQLNAGQLPITCEIASKMTVLECNDSEITSLEGLQQFPNLKRISFSLKGTKVEDLSPIRNLKELETIEIPYSQISEIGFLAKLKKLKNLDLKANHITDLKFLPLMTSIQVLSLEYQKPDYIQDIKALETLTNMRILSLQGNKITDISPLSSMRNLTYLNIRDNRISDLSPLSELTDLFGLNFSINMIDNISPLENLTKLTQIAGSSNKISDTYPLTNLTELISLNLLNNNIEDMNPIANLKKLRTLILDYNSITDISAISELINEGNLIEVGLSYNLIPNESIKNISHPAYLQTLRVDHQSESYPAEAVPDIQEAVNADLVGGKNILEEIGVTLPTFAATSGGGGCSALPLDSNGYIDIVGILCIIAMIIYKRKRNS